ncbi:MAG: PaaI family thioesterase [Gammaproteobacteria bacterium]|nr:PaaI family thioesterase [Gammaproteobacteria bacterium]
MSNTDPDRQFGLAPTERLQALSGHDFLVAIRDGELPAPPMARTLGFQLAEVETGRVVFRATPSLDYYNPLGAVHGGWPATLLDSCMGCAVHSTLPAGTGYTTLEFKIDILRPITEATGPVAAEGRVVRVGRRVGVAEGALTDGAGRVLARGSTTCLVFGH